MTDHPITPPPELFKRWEGQPRSVAFEAAYRAGADMELEACCEWLHWQNLATHPDLIPSLRATRRPKPPSLKEQALTLLDDISDQITAVHENGIRRALEALDD